MNKNKLLLIILFSSIISLFFSQNSAANDDLVSSPLMMLRRGSPGEHREGALRQESENAAINTDQARRTTDPENNSVQATPAEQDSSSTETDTPTEQQQDLTLEDFQRALH